MAGLSKAIDKARAINPEPGSTFMDAEHIVILMQENRSFDHCYGTLQGVRGFEDPRAINLPSNTPVWLQANARGETYVPFRLDMHNTKATWTGWLPHTWQSQVDARNGGKHDHWIEAKRSVNKSYAEMPLTMGYYTREDVPFYYALADAFTICDQHFCSSLTGTMPNRVYFWTGTIRGADATVPAKVRNEEIEYESSASWTTFPERLEELGVSWKIYQNELSLPVGLSHEEENWLSNFGDNPLEWFSQYHTRYHPPYQAHLDHLIASLPETIDKLKASLAVAAPGSAEAASISTELSKAEKNLQASKAEKAKWNLQDFAKLSEKERNLFSKAFCTNGNDPHYHELSELEYEDEGKKRAMSAPKGDVLFQFRQDVKEGKLPTVSWVVAPQHFSDHPESAWYGAWYVSEVLEILTQNPEVWKKTVFILTYDENDGYFDHVPPFVAPDPRSRETGITSKGIDPALEFVTLEQERQHHALKQSREGPIGLGYRVPLVIASPWSRGGYVCSQVFDHTSTLQFLERYISQKTGSKLRETNISAWRRTVCGDLTSAFRPYRGEQIALPSFVAREPFVEAIHKAQFKKLPSDYKALTDAELQETLQRGKACPWMPRQERGMRPSCALPYQLEADGKLNAAQKTFQIEFSAKKDLFADASAGSPFTVYAAANYRSNGDGSKWEKMKNWSFAVTAGDRLSYLWPLDEFEDGGYHLLVHGPNGFYREFKGTKEDPKMDIQVSSQPQGNQLTGLVALTIRNLDEKIPLTLTVKDNAYGGRDQSLQLEPKGQATVTIGNKDSFGWYDSSVLIHSVASFERRFAGRVETGSASMTDPVIGRA